MALCALFVASAEFAQAQVKIGDNPTIINKASILELENSAKGLLFPRVSLTNTTTWSLASGSTPVAGMMVYNIKTVASGFSGTAAYPAIAGDGTGIYYWDGNGWVAGKGLKGTDGKSITGAAGAPGATTPGNEGDTYVNTTTGDTYIKQGNTWVLNGNLKGDKGDPGIVGLPGTSGVPGTPGSGTPGAPGAGVTIVNNDSGTWVYNPTTNTWTNVIGPKGDKGDKGDAGIQNMAGSNGTPGTPGQPGGPGAGVTVVTNDSGTWVYNTTTGTWTNIKGDKGDKGDPGIVGLPGTSGVPGTPGSGTPGAPGAGVTIVNNDSGTWVYNPTTNTWTNVIGPKGDKGDPGIVGLPGTSGVPGTPGSGTPGAPGAGVTIVNNDSGTWVYNPTTNTWTNVIGPKGDKGDPGIVGLPGTSGVPGTPGSGTPGAPGAGVTIVNNDSGTWVYNPTTNTWTNVIGPKGDKGDKGDAGIQNMAGSNGTPGTPGQPGGPGAGVTVVTNDSGTWVYNTTTGTWTNIKGDKGDTGTFNATVDNGLEFSTPTNIQLGGVLTRPVTTITTNTTAGSNTLAIAGLQPGVTTGATPDKIVVADPITGILKSVEQSTLIVEPWQVQSTTNKATDNAQNIYQTGSVAIGKNLAASDVNLDVFGAVRTGQMQYVGPGGVLYPSLHVGTPGLNSVAMGTAVQASGMSAIAMGFNAKSTGLASVALGSAEASGSYAVALGTKNGGGIASGNYTFAASGGIASGNQAMALGFGATASGTASVAMGNETVASSAYSVAMGHRTSAQGSGSFAVGYHTVARPAYSTSIGIANAIVTGTPLTPVNTEALFQIGNGAFGSPSNAITVLRNSHTAIGVSGVEAAAKPTELLDLGGAATAGNGGLKIRNINSAAYTSAEASDKIVVADANGVLKTKDATALNATNWQITGNAGTTAANFLGTTDDVPLNFKIDNTVAGNVSKTGTSFGYKSNVGSGVQNTAIGVEALAVNTTGFQNTGIGYYALQDNTEGVNNTAIGNETLLWNTTGSSNTAVGNYAIRLNTTGRGNTSMGHNSLSNNRTGNANIAIGENANNQNTTGSDNISIGNHSLLANLTGSRNIALGNLANVTGNNLTNAIAIGFASNVGASNSLALGGTGFYQVNVGINTPTPSNKLHVVGDGTVDPIRVEGLQASADAADRVVVADANGVLKTVTAASLAGAAVTADNGLTKTADNIQLGGPLTKTTTITSNNKALLFDSEERRIRFDPNGRIGSEAKGTNDGDMYVTSGSGATYSRFDMQSFPSGQVNLTATGAGVQKLLITTHITTDPAPLVFSTSPGGNASGVERMRITGTGNVGIATPDDPSEKLDIADGNLRVRNINTNLGTSSDKVVVADANGVLKTVATVTAAPQFFYAPSLVLPTSNTNLPNYVTYSGGTFTVNLHGIYQNQFGMVGNVSGAARTAIKSPTATTLPVLGAAALEYFVTYFDNTVFDPTSITLSDTGVLTYQVLGTASVTEKTYMNIVFKVK